MLRPPLLLLLLCYAWCSLCFCGEYPAAEWTQWRGPEQNGVSRDKGLPDSFNPDTNENIVWKAPVGGRSTPVIMNGRVYLIGYSGSDVTTQERMVCLDDSNGKQI